MTDPAREIVEGMTSFPLEVRAENLCYITIDLTLQQTVAHNHTGKTFLSLPSLPILPSSAIWLLI